MKVTIRKASADDSAAIAQISRDALGYECTDELVQHRLLSINENQETVLTAVCDGTIAGFVHVQLYDLLYSERLVNILGLAVDMHYRKMGIGRQLMEAAEKWAREHGAVGVRLNSGGTRHEAHEFYRSVGYNSEKQQIRFLKQW